MKIAIFGSIDGFPSLDRYARELARNFPPEVEVAEVAFPKGRGLVGRIVDRYLKYLWIAPSRQGDYNIIVNESNAFLLLRVDPARTLVVCHDVHPLIYRGPAPRGFWRMRYKFNLRMLRRAKYVVTVSQHTRKDLLKYCPFLRPERVVAVHSGVETNWGATRDAARLAAFRRQHGLEGKRFVLHVGNDNWYKNFAGLLRAFAAVPQPELVLAKVGDLGAANQELIRTLGLEGRVLHVPRAGHEELMDFYSAAETLVFPSFHEGFGWPPLEAMACGCPVIASQKASLPEVCGDACLYVDPHDTAGITAAMQRMLGDNGLRASLIARGKEQCRKFSWRNTAQGMLELLVKKESR